MLRIIILSIMQCLPITCSNAQVMDRKLMKDFRDIPEKFFWDSQAEARFLASKYPLENDTAFFFSWKNVIPNHYTVLHDKVRNWIKRTYNANGFKIISEDRENGSITVQWNLRNICHRSAGNNKYEVTLRPDITFFFKNNTVITNFRVSRYYVLKTHDSRNSEDNLGDKECHSYYHAAMEWNIADTYPYCKKSKLPKITSSRALIHVYMAMCEMKQISGEALGILSARPKPDTLF